MDVLENIRAARLGNSELDVPALELLILDTQKTKSIASELINELLLLLKTNPEMAMQVPNSVLFALRGVCTFNEELKLVSLHPEIADSKPAIQTLLMSASYKSKKRNEKPVYTQLEQEFYAKVFPMLLDLETETDLVAEIEKVAKVEPYACLEYTPFKEMFSAPAEIKARLMAINVILVNNKLLPPLAYLLWSPLENEDSGDFLLAALAVDYVGDLAWQLHAINDTEFHSRVYAALEELCRKYFVHTDGSAAIDRVFAKLASKSLPVFEELDSKYDLVTIDRIRLMALLPPAYLTTKRAAVIEQLPLNSKTYPVFVNVIQDPALYELTKFTETGLQNLPTPIQLEIAAAATSTDKGANIFHERFPNVLKTAYNMPLTQEYMDSIYRLKDNLRRSGIRIAREASVAVAV